MSNSLKVVCGSVDRGSGQLSRSTLFLALLQGSRTQGKLIAWVTCPHYQIDGVDDVGDRRFACAVFVAGSILSRASSALDLRMQKLVHLLITCLWRWLHRFLHRQQEKCYRRKRMQKPYRHCPRKPAWVVDEVIRIHQETGFGSRKVTATFNGLHKAKVGVSVGKSFVAEQIRAHRYQALQLSKQYRHRRPLPSPRNHTWGVDMTGAEDIHGTSHTIVGMIDAGSRMALAMHTIRQRSALALLEAIIAAAKVHGLPCIIKTDNEACFTSRIFRFGLMCLGIRHQRSRPGSPWQNGRIERLFGTLKEKLDRLTVYHGLGLNQALDEFRFWYNCIRPHQHLDGWTPWEAWHGINPSTHAPKSVMRFIAWDGLLRGYHVRR